ncbi:hypothetical protein SP90_11250 [Halodesulfovibrio spirochaetisodalis]|uniref:Uncharacterized protein n=1 Tax=Halodesulfovibrio spirochaetisodalis TaxID=1560234 RepID=A0A1B7XBE8_9BACT|nr:hypothetical protein SP90_11250 [Halodesulfovibrio spirochaetisodalis]
MQPEQTQKRMQIDRNVYCRMYMFFVGVKAVTKVKLLYCRVLMLLQNTYSPLACVSGEKAALKCKKAPAE